MRAIAAAWPDATIDCLAHPKRREVLENLPFLHHVGGITRRTSHWRGWLPSKRYDLAFVCGHDRALVRYALRVAHRVVALGQGEPTLDNRLWRRVELPSFQSVHAVEMQLALTDTLGLPRAGLHLSYKVTSDEDEWARQQLAQDFTSGVGRPLVGLQIASFPTKAYRDWPVENFVALCKRIRNRHPDAAFLIFGGKLERDRTRYLNESLSGYSIEYAGKLTLRQTAALMNRVDLYIGVDTGPTHIMGALHRPMVALYHGYSPSRLLAPLEHPCLYVVDHPRAGNCGPEASMNEISVDSVWHQVELALSKIGGSCASRS